ncbi:MAG TPA: squalene--hopene cyclase [Tepidisphaeraceae bacterium]
MLISAQTQEVAAVGLDPVFRQIPTADEIRQTTPTIDSALRRAMDCLISKQHPEGYWCGELQGDSILESEFILMKFILGQENDPDLPLIANYLRNIQMPEGGWNMYPGGKPDISGTVKGYFALKLMGDSPEAPHMVRARKVIHELGGAEKCNTFTKFFFACLGQISFDACPAIPPEVVFLPKWFYFNLYNVSAWTRTMILPLGIVTTFRYTRKLRPEQGISELYLDNEAKNQLAPPPKTLLPRSWSDFFLRVDSVLKSYNESPIQSLREAAMKRAEDWLLEHLDGSEGLGAIFPPMVYILIVFRILGYPDSHPRVQLAHKHLRDFYIKEGDTIRLQPCLSPVWDTGLGLHALAEANLSPESDVAKRATQWLLSKEVKFVSDWGRNVKNAQPGGWFFEFENPHYPDVDDTAAVTMALHRLGGVAASAAMNRGLTFLWSMQNDDGGWAAFDRTKDRPLLEKIPFADHNAMQDPSCPDITGRVLEALGHCGFKNTDPRIQRAVAFIRKHQSEDGSWWGRWGVNYIYGTWQILTGMYNVGEDMNQEYVQRAACWLKSVQKPDGSFGESADSYEDPSLKNVGPSTPSQTAWGAMALLAACGPHDPAVVRALNWLAKTQNPDGNWTEEWYTGTGFPKVFYLRYHLYKLYFPITALARYKRRLACA